MDRIECSKCGRLTLQVPGGDDTCLTCWNLKEQRYPLTPAYQEKADSIEAMPGQCEHGFDDQALCAKCDEPDMVNAPPHYRQGGIECIDAIRAALTDEEFRGYCKGNALKYVWRERHKGGAESLAKAQWYLSKL